MGCGCGCGLPSSPDQLGDRPRPGSSTLLSGSHQTTLLSLDFILSRTHQCLQMTLFTNNNINNTAIRLLLKDILRNNVRNKNTDARPKQSMPIPEIIQKVIFVGLILCDNDCHLSCF